MINNTTISTTQNVSHTLNGSDILDLLKIPAEASKITVTVQIPGGGDWSNTRMDILNEHCIHVSYELATKS
jgi:hypothetical protein